MNAEVLKSSPAVIRPPPEPLTMATSGTIKLTSFDRVFVKLPVTALLVFEHHGYETIESIKRALSKALVLYYPIAGRIVSSSADDGDEFSILCTGEGVEFVTASVNRNLQEANILGESTGAKALLDELAIFYAAGSYGSNDPLLSVQVTEFSCGGLVVAATWSHAVADGAGIGQFLAAVGELARGSPSPSVVPARLDDAVSSFPPFPNPILQAMLVWPETTDMELIVPLDITVPSALINRVKAESVAASTFEAVLAVLWRCRVRAVMCNESPGSSPGKAYLTFAMNVRKCVGAKDGYYGNCIAVVLVAATSSVVAEAGIVDLVRMIKRAKDRLRDKVRMGNNAGSSSDDDQMMMMRGLGGRYDMMLVSSWRNIGFEQVDFGSGAPVRVMYHGRQGGVSLLVPTCVMYPPCKGKDGVNLMSLAVKEEHAGAFLEELAKNT